MKSVHTPDQLFSAWNQRSEIPPPPQPRVRTREELEELRKLPKKDARIEIKVVKK